MRHTSDHILVPYWEGVGMGKRGLEVGRGMEEKRVIFHIYIPDCQLI